VNKIDPLRTKSRLPFSPTIKPVFGAGAGGLSGLLYMVAALVLGGYAIYQMRVLGFAFTELRVLITWLGAGWFAFRAAMLFATGGGRAPSSSDQTDDKGA
jgi:hypothetical protein